MLKDRVAPSRIVESVRVERRRGKTRRTSKSREKSRSVGKSVVGGTDLDGARSVVEEEGISLSFAVNRVTQIHNFLENVVSIENKGRERSENSPGISKTEAARPKYGIVSESMDESILTHPEKMGNRARTSGVTRGGVKRTRRR